MGGKIKNRLLFSRKIYTLVILVSSDANRGNVAIIVWNTLEAPYVWDVEATEFEGSINLGNSKRSLLSIYFRDFATTEGKLKEITEIDIEDGDVSDRQLKIATSNFGTATELKTFDFAAEPRKNKDEKSYVKNTTAFVYVPEEVIADLDEVEGKTITLILGEDNVAVAVIIENDIAEEDFLTAYDATKEKITVGGTKYNLAKDVDSDDNGSDDAYGYTVKLNGTPITGTYSTKTPIAAALELITAVTDVEDIEKKIKATLTLNDDDDVEAIELFVSADLANTKEAIVTKIRETSKKYEIQTTAGDIEWELEDEEELKFPKVYTNGTRSDIKDIEVGNVLTIITENGKSEVDFEGSDVSKIYVGTETVTGEATRVKKLNNAITIDGTVYFATHKNDIKMTTKEIEDEDFVPFNSTTVLDNEEVTLYLNTMGEYVVVSLAEDVSDYQFGIVTKVYTTDGLEEIDGDEYAQKSIKVLLADGEEVRFTVQTNDDDKDTPSESELNAMFGTGKIEQGAFIMFIANSDKVITLSEDEDEIMLVEDYTGTDYVLSEIVTGTPVTGKKFTTDDGQYSYTTDTVIFNSHVVPVGTPGDKTNLEVVAKWDSILKSDNTFEVVASTKAYAVVKEGSTKALYIVVDSKYSPSDYELAIVNSKLDEVKEDKYEIDFVGQENVEVDNNATVIAKLTNVIDWLIEYTTKNDKVNDANKLIDMAALEDSDTDDLIDGIFESGTDLILDAKFEDGVIFTQLKVSEIYIDGDDFADITFSAGDDKTVVNEKYAFEKNKANYYTEAAGVLTSVASATYSSTTKYYKLVDKGASEVDGAKYYNTSDLSAPTTFALANKMLVEVDLKDVDAKLGTIELDAEELKVYDLRGGDVKEITLTSEENPGFSAVVYKENGLSKANVIFIID